jgi:vancomycin resistance protein VanW
MTAGAVRRLARRGVPADLRQLYAEARRRWRDRTAGVTFAPERGGGAWPVRVELAQRVGCGQLYESKLSNLGRGTAAIDESLLEPGGRWSFWRRVGRPSTANGYLEGRTISDGRLVREVGGGLCQLSGLLYHLALLGGLEVVERHPHSIDIYREEERYTPLGSDATVVWGYKDLRLRNPHPFSVSITCGLEDGRLVARVRSGEALAPLEVSFVREQIAPARVRVLTLVGGRRIDATEYEQRPGLPLL